MIPATAYGIFDVSVPTPHLMEDSATGRLLVFYALEDATFALPGIKRTSPPGFKLEVREIRMREVKVSQR